MNDTPLQAPDDAARALSNAILASCTHAALGTLDPQTGAPTVSRIAFAWLDNAPLALVSELSQHTQALRHDPRASVMLVRDDQKGDPLTHPRLTLQTHVVWVKKEKGRAAWLAARPKSKLYFDFADFSLVRFEIETAFLNAGFGKAYTLSADDL